MTYSGARDAIEVEVLKWAHVEKHQHRFGGHEYRIGKRELGHIHGDQLLDIPFPVAVRNEVIAAGRAEKHHILPESGWISFYLNKADDISAAIGLLRQSYELALKQKGLDLKSVNAYCVKLSGI